jgi:hypothetical protein
MLALGGSSAEALNITFMLSLFLTVADGTDLDNAITVIDAGGADAVPDTAYTIDVTGLVSLDADPLAIDLDSG